MSRWDEWTAAELSERQMLSATATTLDHHEKEFELLGKRLDRMNGILVGILISVTTSAVLLAINLGVS